MRVRTAYGILVTVRTKRGTAMLKLERTSVMNLENAMRGARNPMNSWAKSDSAYDDKGNYILGENDLALARKLCRAGSDHRKFVRQILVSVDITAPLYWWKEFDTYKVGTVANSCSTMHKIHAKEFTLDDFSHEHLQLSSLMLCNLRSTIAILNEWRKLFNYTDEQRKDYFNYNGYPEVLSKEDCWWQMIQLLPSSYNQKRTVLLNYEVLANIYKWRKNHKLDEWRDFCRWIEQLPYSNVIVRECGCTADE